MRKVDTTIHHAGVIRCCVEGVCRLGEDVELSDGHFIPCPHGCKEGGGMTLDGETWRAAWIVSSKRRDATNTDTKRTT